VHNTAARLGVIQVRPLARRHLAWWCDGLNSVKLFSVISALLDIFGAMRLSECFVHREKTTVYRRDGELWERVRGMGRSSISNTLGQRLDRRRWHTSATPYVHLHHEFHGVQDGLVTDPDST
jgi:hypothetical protein